MRFSRRTLPKHRQEGLCHTDSADGHNVVEYQRVNVAQTLLSVLARLAMTENYARDNR
jgi:hypothetical protein